MSISTVFGQANVIGGTVPTLIVAQAGNLEFLPIYNAGAATVYIGGAAVTTANGFPVGASTKEFFFGPGPFYGIVASGTIDVRYHYGV